MARYSADVKFIASIYPGQLPDIRRNYGLSKNCDGDGAQRSTLFHMEPVPRGAPPYVIAVFDSFESVRDFVRQAGGPRAKYNPNMVEVESIVNDLLGQWAGNQHLIPQQPPATPGIIEINPLPAELKNFSREGILPKPNGEELEVMRARQTAYFEFLFNEGEKISRGDHQAINQWSNYTPEMRLAAKWLDRHTQWSDPAMASDNEPCPFCQQLITPAAYVCKWCHRTVRAIPPELLKLMEQTVGTRLQ